MSRNKRTVLLGLILALSQFADVANADYIFGTPTNLGPTVNSWRSDDAANISPDGLTLFFTSNRSGGSGQSDLWVSTRATIDDPWSEAVNLGTTVNSSTYDGCSSISVDGLTLYFSAYNRSGGRGGSEIWMTTRATTDDDWSTPVNLDAPVSSGKDEWSQSISADGLSFYFGSRRSGGSGDFDLWVTTRATIDDDWSTSVNLGATVNSSAEDFAPSISADGNTLFFESGRTGGFGNQDLWMTRRNMAEGDWTTPVNLGPTVNSSSDDGAASISADGSALYFNSDRPGGYGDYDIWQVSIDPVVDLNSDGIVDALDMCIIVDYWGTDEPLCDIGPTPFGDGVVDVQDLIVLAEHLFEEVVDPNAADFIVVDDFEAYNEIWPGEGGSNLIFMTWADGYEVPENGSSMGSLEALVETSIVHEGSQSAPLHYDNTIVAFSEVTAYVANQQPAWPPNSLPIGPDWTEEGVGVLSLWFHGKADNDAEPMYVALNGIAVYHDNANATQVAEWEEWTIPLQEFADLGVDLTNVNSITIGFGTQGDPTTAGGSGMVLFDDIRIYTGQ